MKRILALVATFALAFSLLTACGTQNKDNADNSIENANDFVVMTINGEDIYASEYASYIKETKYMFENNYSYYTGTELTDEVWQDEEVISSIYENAKQSLYYPYAIHTVAKECELELGKDDLDEVQSIIDQNIEYSGGQVEFKKYLAENMGIDETEFRSRVENAVYIEKIEAYNFGEDGKTPVTEDDIKKYYNDNYYRAKHILVKTVDENNETLPDDEIKQKEAIAKDIIVKLNNGEDFDTLLEAYGEDEGMKQSPDGYTFSSNDSFLPEFIDGTKVLEIGKYSNEPVKTTYGYHIILREPLTQEALMDETGSVSGAKIYDEIYQTFADIDSIIDEALNNLTININDENINKITLDNYENYLKV